LRKFKALVSRLAPNRRKGVLVLALRARVCSRYISYPDEVDKQGFEMRSLNLDQLRTLATVAKLGSFSAAARELSLTQPAVSLQIRDLEQRVGLRLIDRDGKNARPTAAGQDLIAHAERMMAEADRALAAMRGHKEGQAGRVRLGTGPTALAYILPPVLQRLRADHPDVELVLTTGTTQEITARLLENVLDLGLTALPVDQEQFDVITIREDEMVAIFSTTDCAIPDKVTPADLAGRPLILEYYRVNQNRLARGWLSAAGVEAKPALQFDGIEAMKDAVAAGLGVAIVPRPALSGGRAIEQITARPLDPPLVRTLGLIQRHDKPNDPALLLVREAILSLRAPEDDSETADHRSQGARTKSA
jgi:DNA-binding transcriptional LysR family regulator